MTKKLMIETMQLKEAALWLALCKANADSEAVPKTTQRKRSEWYSISSLMDELKVSTDVMLPDNQEALEICLTQLRDKRMVEELEQADFDSRDINS